MSFPPGVIARSLEHLHAADPVMSRLIDRVGPFLLKPRRNRFEMLVRSIISQQISGSAARSIYARLKEQLAPRSLCAEAIANLSLRQFRACGVSPQKSGYLLDLSRKVLDRSVRLDGISRLPDEEVIEELIAVKGIGVWTAQMFLIFCLGRLDVFPHDDLGIRVALRNLYRLGDLPDKATSHRIAERWRPFATVASWYCWRSLDLNKVEKKDER